MNIIQQVLEKAGLADHVKKMNGVAIISAGSQKIELSDRGVRTLPHPGHVYYTDGRGAMDIESTAEYLRFLYSKPY